jgi:tRNA(fMet)-specific endonuclease VapC
LAPQGLAISLVTLAELYEAAYSSVNPDADLSIYRKFLLPVRKLSLTEPIVERFAEIRSFLRRRGQLIADFDVLIAATALHYDFTLLTYNKEHFRRIPDLRIFAAS